MKYNEEIKKLDDQYRQVSAQMHKYADVIYKFESANMALGWLDEDFDECKIDQKLIDKKDELSTKLTIINAQKKEIENEVEKKLESHKRDFVFITWVEIGYINSEKQSCAKYYDFSFKYSTLIKNRWILEKKILPLIDKQSIFEDLKKKAIERAKKEGKKNINIVSRHLHVRLDRVDSAYTLDRWNEAIDLKTIVPEVDKIIHETDYLANCGNIKWIK